MSLKAVKKQFKEFYNKHFPEWFFKAGNTLSTLKNQTITKNKSILSPLVFIIAAMIAIFSFGVAALSLISLFGSLLILYFVFTSIFGINLDWSDVVRV